MEFRPCIDIHNGQVKQIVGGSLLDRGDLAEENFVSGQDAGFYARMYRDSGIKGGHIILLNPKESRYYKDTKAQAMLALSQYPGGLQVGGGINDENARQFIEAGASHVIVTSFVFKDGRINYDNLDRLVEAVGKERIVLDLSCRCREGKYYIVTDRWQKFTSEVVNDDTLDRLSAYCSEFLIHAVDVEGKASGIERGLVWLLGKWGKMPITYAGGVSSFSDLEDIYELGRNKLNVTIGSALDLFGGDMEYSEVLDFCRRK